jgi:hypothetical protein
MPDAATATGWRKPGVDEETAFSFKPDEEAEEEEEEAAAELLRGVETGPKAGSAMPNEAISDDGSAIGWPV